MSEGTVCRYCQQVHEWDIECDVQPPPPLSDLSWSRARGLLSNESEPVFDDPARDDS